MAHATLIHHTDHRPWPLPSQPWVMRQTWYDLLFAHWPIAPEVMRPLIPPQLQLDTFEGMAWVAVVPFGMSNVAPRGFPNVPGISAFLELNVRTYVTAPVPPEGDPHGGKPGVYFFSLEAANPIAVSLARNVFKLPYFNATMRLKHHGDLENSGRIEYESHRAHRGARPAEFVGTYGPTGATYLSQPGTLENWLTERYCLYTTHHDTLYRGEIHHLPWPLQPASAEISVNTMTEAADITLPALPPILHFARRLDVIVWPLRRVS